MRKLLIAATALTVALAIAAVAYAQNATPIINGALKVTPTKAGTTKKPKNGLVQMGFTVNQESNSTVKRIEFTIPKKVKIDGTGFKHCSVNTINQNGDDACPGKSKVGTGTATALLGPQKSQLNFNIEIYVQADKTLALYLQTSLFNIAIEGQIQGPVIGIDIPERVQSPVSGLYAYITGVSAKLGKQSGISGEVTTGSGKKKKTRYFASVVACPGTGHVGAVKAFLAPNPDPPAIPFIEDVATSSCTS
jgi:hypothetical protein